MKLIPNMVVVLLLLLLMSLTAYAGEKAAVDEKPSRQDIALLSIEATVESIDRQTREVTLKNEQGETVSFQLDEDAGRIDDIEAGDQVTIEYLEAVTIQVFAPDKVEPKAASEAVVAQTPVGEKPAGLAVGHVSVVVTIESIDLENELVTLKNKDGEMKTVRPENPENLKKVEVGDKVKITYTQAVGFKVIEKPAKQ
jgi:Cu/Ag efflux protein CusF